jgi:hypothetical protein
MNVIANCRNGLETFTKAMEGQSTIGDHTSALLLVFIASVDLELGSVGISRNYVIT